MPYINAALATPVFPDSNLVKQASPFQNAAIPIANLFDSNQYNGTSASETIGLTYGLSEYTSANFFSPDTIFDSGYPFPRLASVQEYDEVINPSKGKKRTYLRKIGDGEQVEHLATGSWLYKYLPAAMKNSGHGLKLDEKVYADYAAKLLPRAVGYSAALLDYFFRGNIEISLPARGVYGIAAADNTFKEIRLKAKNITTNGEEMSNGQIQLVVKHLLAEEDPFQSYPVFTDTVFHYIVVPEKNGVTAISRTTPTELVFDLSATPIPLWATDVYIQVVYRGQLGNEAGAVAVGFKDISEPTPVDVFNNTDYVCLNDTWCQSGSAGALAITDTNHDGRADLDDIYAHDIRNIYAKFSPLSSPVAATSTNYNINDPGPVLPAGFKRLGYILTDYSFNYSFLEDWFIRHPNDTFTLPSDAATYTGTAVKNQLDPDDISYYPYMYSMRGKLMWWGTSVIYDNYEYPSGSYCAWEDLPPAP